jgi:hypothetical protein
MRMLIGLTALLGGIVALVIIMSWVELPKAQQDISAGRQAAEQARQIAGYDEHGGHAMDAIKLDTVRAGNHITGLVVRSVDPQTGLGRYFGLVPTDTITRINDSKIGDIGLEDEDLCKAQVLQAYQSRWPLVVMRNGQELTLPAAPAHTQAPVPGSAQDPARRLLNRPAD